MLFGGTAVACSSSSKEGSAALAFLPHFWRFAAARADVLATVADGAALVPSFVYPGAAPTVAAEGAEGAEGAKEPLPAYVTLSPLSRMHALLALQVGPPGRHSMAQYPGTSTPLWLACRCGAGPPGNPSMA